MSRFRSDSALTNELSKRGRRAVGLGVLAVVVIAAAGFAYLRSSEMPSTRTTIGVPPTNTVLAAPNPVTYDFVTPSVGWAVENLNTPTTPAGGFAIFKTTDGAKHWQKQLELGSSFVGFVRFSVQFIDQAHGFVAVGDPFEQLIRTADGGATWDSIPLPFGSHVVEDIAFSGSRYGWMLLGGEASTILATNDAGTTWERLPDPPRDASGIRYRSPSEAWMGSAATSPTAPHVYLSRDGGFNWSEIGLPPSPRSSSSFAGYLPANVELLPRRGVVVHVPQFEPPGLVPFNRTLTSFDLGATWRDVPAPPGVLAYQDAVHWWAMKGTSLFKSSDAGQTWAVVTKTLPDLQYIPHILDRQHAWALTIIVGGYGLATTSDGGLHWTQANVPAP